MDELRLRWIACPALAAESMTPGPCKRFEFFRVLYGIMEESSVKDFVLGDMGQLGPQLELDLWIGKCSTSKKGLEMFNFQVD